LVKNSRVGEIQDLSFCCITSDHNPSDCATRDLSVMDNKTALLTDKGDLRYEILLHAMYKNITNYKFEKNCG